MTDFDPKAAWTKASPELRALARATLPRAYEIAREYLTTGDLKAAPQPAPGSLQEALDRAAALDTKLEDEEVRRAEAEALLRGTLAAALKIALASVL